MRISRQDQLHALEDMAGFTLLHMLVRTGLTQLLSSLFRVVTVSGSTQLKPWWVGHSGNDGDVEDNASDI